MPLHKYTPGCPCCICSVGLSAAQLAASTALPWTPAVTPTWGVDGDGLLELTNAGSGAEGSASRLVSVGTNTQLQMAIAWDSLVSSTITGIGLSGFLGFHRDRTGSNDKYELVTLDDELKPVTVIDSFNAGERNTTPALSSLKNFRIIATRINDSTCEVLYYFGSSAFPTAETYLASVSVPWPANARFGIYSNEQSTKVFSASLTCGTSAAPEAKCYPYCNSEWIPAFYYLRAASALACLTDPFAGGLFDDIAPFATDVAMQFSNTGDACYWVKTIQQPAGLQRVHYTLAVGEIAFPAGTAQLVMTLNGDGSPGSHYTDFYFLCDDFDCTAAENTFYFAYSHPNTEECFDLDPPDDIIVYRDPA